jgi:general secretion pathway protein K
VSATQSGGPDGAVQRRSRDGFVIVAVLWILMALATLVSIYSIYVGHSALALSAIDDGLRVESLVSTGVELSVYRLTAPTTGKRPTRGGFRFRLNGANAVVSFTPENARVDLNVAPKEMLARLFAALGATDEEADSDADRVIGWRTPPKRGAESSEDNLYRSAKLSYLPRGATFPHVSELWLVHGLAPALVARVLPFVTVYSGRAEINVFDAPPEVMAALPGMSGARLTSFLDRRDTIPHDPDALALLLGPDQKGATADASPSVRVRVQIAFDNGHKTTSEVVILLGTDSEPYRVLSWRDNVDAAPDQTRTAPRLE